MDDATLRKIPAHVQDIALGEQDVARAVALVGPTNERIRKAADLRLRFEDEPATYISLLLAEGQPK